MLLYGIFAVVIPLQLDHLNLEAKANVSGKNKPKKRTNQNNNRQHAERFGNWKMSQVGGLLSNPGEQTQGEQLLPL